ncbi:helix-turn-helix transcriptional regulator [Chitinophaga nivalis]|uniref:AraC family transcriptional regulator n=1 Tax=Chitinophaga nivalis TaxID=2991709 RepID=A0ABT3IPR4_9BACT|nr:AraC family transcriptional regulator [Chitinophaga nivalis]MCW3464347.1 AraC family transcriptional regulator [Chitinophaga nivalis]MCW3485962.1 AraC family transcriptional regulator [Chitinophaga nivalis]
MGVKIMNDANVVLLSEEAPFDSEKWTSREIVEETQELNRHFGSAKVREFHFDGVHIIDCTADLYENILIASEEILPRVMMLFVEQGNMVTSVEGMRKSLAFSSKEHNLLYTPYLCETAAVSKQRDIQVFGLSYTPERFLELADHSGRVLHTLANNVAGNKSVLLADKINLQLTPRMLSIFAEVRQCQFKGGLKKLFLQSKAIELLALQCEQIENGTRNKENVAAQKVATSDLEKLHHARELLLQHLQEPLSLAQLARVTGLNEFKLKSGFKHVFDNTVFGYLSEQRLELSRKLLLDTNKPLSEIAEQAGFSSPQHFSNAFRKKFGVSPGKMRM